MVQHACLACPVGQKKFAKTRGLCHVCYQQFLAKVNAGETTWEELKAQGKALLTLKELGKRRPLSSSLLDHSIARWNANNGR